MSARVRGSLVCSLHTHKMYDTRLPDELHKGNTPPPNELHNGDKMSSPTETPNTHTHTHTRDSFGDAVDNAVSGCV